MKKSRPSEKSYFFPRILLLLKKNFILRRRQWVVTGLEIILPTLFAILLAVFKTWTPTSPSQPPNAIYEHPAFTEKDLVEEISRWTRVPKRYRTGGEKKFILGYAPSNQFTDQIMTVFQASLEKYKTGRIKLAHETRAFQSESDIIAFNEKNGIGNGNGNGNGSERTQNILKAAVIFEDGFAKSREDFLQDAHAQSLSYKIRIVDKVNDNEFPTNVMYPYIRFPGPGANTAPKGYKLGGFTSVQVFLDKAIISVITNQTVKHTIGVQAFPYPAYKGDLDFSRLYIPFLPVLLVFGFIFIVPSILRNVVAEKESGMKELMRTMGLRSYMHWFSWLLDSMLMLVVPVTVVTINLFAPYSSETGAFLVYSSYTLWWVNLFLFGVSTISALFFMSTFFHSTPMAISVGIVLWIVSYFSMFVPLVSNYEWLSLSQKMLSCFAPHMAFHWALRMMYSFEVKRIGATWSNIGQPLNSLDNFTVAQVMTMQIISTCVYAILTLYFEAVLPSQHGIRKPWNFCFKLSFWRDIFNLKSDQKFSNVEHQMLETMSPKGQGYGQGQGQFQSSKGFEDDLLNSNLNARVKIQNLTKRFGSKMAVDDLSLTMYDGHITALLGCNGAGKTTLISMLTGMFGPSDGSATIDGHNVVTDMTSIRQQLGFCPQHNVLFEKLTVEENLDFFGRLKGMKSEEVQKEMKDLVEKLQLGKKQQVLAGHLSGGQKRKLCLGMAIIGSSKVVVLDEPTAGMDPEARRGIWDLLLEIKQDRTILLTTHFMEEADILGDRVAIMSAGKIHCCGSPLFLKQYYGSGYTLKLTVKAPPASDSNLIFKLVSAHAPDAQWAQGTSTPPSLINDHTVTEAASQVKVSDISIVLPQNHGRNDTSKFPALFAELTSRKEELGIVNIGLPLTTLDDVFTKVAQETKSKDTSHRSERKDKKAEKTDRLQDPENIYQTYEAEVSLSRFLIVFQQLHGLLLKRYYYTLRHKKLFAVQILLPLLIVISSVLIFNGQNAPLPPRPPLQINLNPYKDPKIIYAAAAADAAAADGDGDNDETTELGKIYMSIIAQTPKSVNAQVEQARTNSTNSLDKTLLSICRKNEDEYRERYVVAASFEANEYVRAMFQTIPFHASPLAVNLVSNTLLRYYLNAATAAGNISENGDQGKTKMKIKTNDIKISVTHEPMRGGIRTLLDSATANPDAAKHLPLIFALLMPLGLSTLAASFIVFPLEERLSQAKSLQIMTGLNICTFWMASFLWDLLLIVGLAIVMVIFFPILGNYSAFTIANAAPTFFLIIFMFGLSAISLSYLVSLIMSTIAGGFALITISGIITGTLGVLLVHILEQCNFFDAAHLTRFLFRPFPTFGASLSLVRFVDKILRNVKCNMVSDKLKRIICNTETKFDTRLNVEDFQGCCDSCDHPSFSENGVHCFKTNPLLTWKSASESDHVSQDVLFPGIGQELLCMLISFLVFQILLFLIEIFKPKIVTLSARATASAKGSALRFKNYIMGKALKRKLVRKVKEVKATLDYDVQQEKGRVQNLIEKEATQTDAIVVENLTKDYGSLQAVSKITFGVQKGECFGLLGVNGAGKTTLFKMMTGNLEPKSGNAYIEQFTLNTNPREYSRQIGYCPQYDGLIGCLTGRETLVLFSRLRAIPMCRVEKEASYWLQQLGLESAGEVQVGHYSGGMKRRLSVGMSMIGHPSVLMLDEPTSGVDPVSRRQFWTLVTSGKKVGQALILTSHSMDECEALCSRLGIMVDGRLECLGTIQHLKTKFSNGFTITLKINQNLPPAQWDAHQSAFCTEIGNRFGVCTLKEQHKNMLEYHVVPSASAGTTDWGAVFQLLQEIKCRNSETNLVEDYFVNEVSLEEIFMSIARSKRSANQKQNLTTELDLNV